MNDNNHSKLSKQKSPTEIKGFLVYMYTMEKKELLWRLLWFFFFLCKNGFGTNFKHFCELINEMIVEGVLKDSHQNFVNKLKESDKKELLYHKILYTGN